MFRHKYKLVITYFIVIGLFLGFFILFHYTLKTNEPYVNFSGHPLMAMKSDEADKNTSTLRFAVATMWSVENTYFLYRRMTERIASDAGLQKSMIIKPSYKALCQSLEKYEIDVAFVCTGPYVYTLASGSIRLLVEPEFINGESYHSVIIVPSRSTAKSVEDLRGMVIGFSDSESFTGYIVPYVMMREKNIDPDKFFKKEVFTGSHDRSIIAVERGIVDAAAVHSIVWESAKREDTSLKDRLREIWSSDTFGPPPVIVSNQVRYSLADSLKKAFLNLNKDTEGRAILSAVGIKRFIPAREEDYLTAQKLYKRYEDMKDKN